MSTQTIVALAALTATAIAVEAPPCTSYTISIPANGGVPSTSYALNSGNDYIAEYDEEGRYIGWTRLGWSSACDTDATGACLPDTEYFTCSDIAHFSSPDACVQIDFTDVESNSAGNTDQLDRYEVFLNGVSIGETHDNPFPTDDTNVAPGAAFASYEYSSLSKSVDTASGTNEVTFDLAEYGGTNSAGEAWIRIQHGSSAGVCGDPHFVSFNGEGFDFMGEPDAYYNIITSERFQLNAHFAKTVLTDGHVMEHEGELLTLVDEVGIQVNGYEVFFSVNGTAQVNGQDIAVNQVMSLGDGAFLGFRYGNKHDQPLGSSVPPQLREKWFGDEVHTPSYVATVGLFGMTTTFYVVDTPRLPGVTFMDMEFFRPSYYRSIPMHGIVGQTNAGTISERGVFDPVEGVDGDYVVSGVFGNDFEANLFA